MTDLQSDKRIALITGASRGIGRAVALGMAKAGIHVVVTARAQPDLESLDDEIRALGGAATLVPLDLKDGPGIDRLGGVIAERWKRLDILVGNAGLLGSLTPLPHIGPGVWDDLLAVNVTANWRLLRSFDPLLRASRAGRVIFVTSGAAGKDKPYWGGYAITKAALNQMARTYAAETAKTGVRVNLLNPGPTRTAMRALAFPGEGPETMPAPAELVPLFLKLADPALTESGEIFNFADFHENA